MTDAEIVALYLARDEAAISQTARQYGARLCRIANQILNDPSGAEECENDTYWEAWRRIPPHEPRDYLFAFLGRITRRLAIDVCRKNAAQKRSALLCELTAEMA
ncbi:MAG: RNA polymerase subunit sigma-70, partial [Oscillospiraceae bacterium]|nr:RNA polymerase subunit sigma-70 [Oscillospiraceae bacterium]